MENKFRSFLFGAAMLVAGVAFTACGSDDEPTKKPESKATKVTAQPVVYVCDEVLASYDVVLDYNGQKVTVTTENTQPATYKSPTGSYQYEDVRKYTGPSTTLTSFPAKVTATGTCKLKEGLSLDNFEKINYNFAVQFEVSNDNGNFWKLMSNPQIFSHSTPVIAKLNETMRKWFSDAQITAEATFETADVCALKNTRNIDNI